MSEALIRQIQKAMDNHELKAYYQPQYDAITNKIVSAEALVRWIKEDGSIIPPMSFIPELEKTDAVTAVDWYMVNEACQVIKKQMESGKALPISVNFSRWHVNEEGFVDRLNSVVDSYGIKHRMIEVEITESALVAESEGIEKWIRSIRDAGYSVAIDDFGSGLSSLQFVKDMPVDILKIDKSLLSHNCENEKERIVLESIFYFAHRLKMVTVAEGVETKEQIGFLRTCNCEKIQGYYYAKPMPEEKYITLVAEKRKGIKSEDILEIQTSNSAMQLLMDAVFMKYPLVIFTNLTRNSFYMMAYENFSTTSCPSTGVFDELIVHGAATMHPDDKEIFATTFNRERLLEAQARGEKIITLTTRQMGDDGVYHEVETTDYFVKHPSVDDVIAITLCETKN